MRKILLTVFLLSILLSCKNPLSNIFKNNSAGDGGIASFEDKKAGLSDIQKSLHNIAKEAENSVVFISTEKTVTQRYYDPFENFFNDPWGDDRSSKPQVRKYKQSGLGSGVIYSKNGDNYYIITNNHVVEGADTIKAMINEKRTFTGTLLGRDKALDIAVVRIKSAEALGVAKFGNSDKVLVGDFVAAVGNPYGLSNTMTFGIVSATGRHNLHSERPSLTNFIQTDASINPGNSGGPLFNMKNEVIGINALIYSENGGNVGIGFTIPSNIAVKTAEQLIKKGKVEHGFLGVIFKEVKKEDAESLGIKNIEGGILVAQLVGGSPAEKYGIRTGDVIIEINGKKVLNQNDFTMAIGNLEPGTKISIKLIRNSRETSVDVVLGTRSEK